MLPLAISRESFSTVSKISATLRPLAAWLVPRMIAEARLTLANPVLDVILDIPPFSPAMSCCHVGELFWFLA